MFCPKCGTQLEGNTICSGCGFNASEVDHVTDDPSTDTRQSLVNVAAVKQVKSVLSIKIALFSVLAIVVLVMFFMAASKISEGGLNILGIQSVGGKTLEEAYYFELGNIYAGYAIIARAIGIFFASVLAWIGLKK